MSASLRTCASAPTRIDFAGGWTDVAPYTVERGGMVCNLAIDLRATVQVMPSATADAPAEPLVRAAWTMAGAPAVTIAVQTAFPAGSGLGGSSAVGVALAAALAQHTSGTLPAPQALAERSRTTETTLLGVPGGCQDHYAAAFGGALLLACRAETTVTPIALPQATIDALEARLCLVFTGESRMSGPMIDAVLDAWRAGDARVRTAMDAMAALAPRIAEVLRAGDIDALATLLEAQWTAQRALHPAITTATIDAIEHAARAAGAQAIKALGASGGGCVVVVAPVDRMAAVRDAVSPHGTVLPWRVARDGVRTWTEAA